MKIVAMPTNTDKEKLEKAIADIEKTEVKLRDSVQNEKLVKLQLMLEKLP